MRVNLIITAFLLCSLLVMQPVAAATATSAAESDGKPVDQSAAAAAKAAAEKEKAAAAAMKEFMEKWDKDKSGTIDDAEAIAGLHRELDKNNDGSVNPAESQNFLNTITGDLSHHAAGIDRFHGYDTDNDKDNFVSVKELQTAWNNSAVRHWTTREVSLWLENIVGLPQYVSVFKSQRVDGKKLPLFALQQGKLLRDLLHIHNAEHIRQIASRITLDVIFSQHVADDESWIPIFLYTLIVGAIGIAVYLHLNNQKVKSEFEAQLQRVNKTTEERERQAAKEHEESRAKIQQELETLKSQWMSHTLQQNEQTQLNEKALSLLSETFYSELRYLEEKDIEVVKSWRAAREEFEKKNPSSLKNVQLWRRPEDFYKKARQSIDQAQEAKLRVQEERDLFQHRWVQIEEVIVRPMGLSLNLPFYKEYTMPRSASSRLLSSLSPQLSGSTEDVTSVKSLNLI